MTDAVREELAPRGIHVAALHVGFMDTDMAEFVPADQKVDPAVVARQALDGLFAGEPEILADELTRTVRLTVVAAGRVVTAAKVGALAVHLIVNTELTSATFDVDGGRQFVSG